MLSFPMPFRCVPCSIWLAQVGTDAYGNEVTTYAEHADIETRCAYAPGGSEPNTQADIEDGRPHGASVSMTFFLPKALDADMREALIACYPPDDATLSGRKFKVVGNPYSYPRANTPGDYSWCVEGVRFLG